jgi:hypothetical protein
VLCCDCYITISSEPNSNSSAELKVVPRVRRPDEGKRRQRPGNRIEGESVEGALRVADEGVASVESREDAACVVQLDDSSNIKRKIICTGSVDHDEREGSRRRRKYGDVEVAPAETGNTWPGFAEDTELTKTLSDFHTKEALTQGANVFAIAQSAAVMWKEIAFSLNCNTPIKVESKSPSDTRVGSAAVEVGFRDGSEVPAQFDFAGFSLSCGSGGPKSQSYRRRCQNECLSHFISF